MRREFLGLLSAFGVAARASEPQSCILRGELDLPADISADLVRFSQFPLKQADWLKELPLDGIPLCFRYTPK
jgi:hypothetical protein